MKKWISVLLCLALFFMCVVPCFAENTIGPSGALPPTEEELAEAEATFNPDVLSLDWTDNTRAATWYGMTMTYYAQLQSMSCGPACTRMVLKYVTGIGYSEATIRNGMVYSETSGTTLGALTNYIKDKSDRYYTNYYGTSQAYIMSGMMSSIRNYDSPPSVGLKSSQAYGFPVTGSGGHFIVINGITSDLDTVKVLDPWSGYSGNGYNGSLPANYQITANNLMNAYNSLSVRAGVGMQLSQSELIPSKVNENTI